MEQGSGANDGIELFMDPLVAALEDHALFRTHDDRALPSVERLRHHGSPEVPRRPPAMRLVAFDMEHLLLFVWHGPSASLRSLCVQASHVPESYNIVSMDYAITFEVMRVMASGGVVTLVGHQRCAVVHLSDSAIAMATTSAADSGRGRTVVEAHVTFPGAQVTQLHSSVCIVRASWHPLSDQHLAILYSDGMLRLYHTNAYAGEDAQQVFDVRFRDATRPSSTPVDSTAAHCPVAFAWAGSSVSTASSWEPFTAYFVTSWGQLYAVCPICPHGMPLAQSRLDSLNTLVSGQMKRINKAVSKARSRYRATSVAGGGQGYGGISPAEGKQLFAVLSSRLDQQANLEQQRLWLTQACSHETVSLPSDTDNEVERWRQTVVPPAFHGLPLVPQPVSLREKVEAVPETEVACDVFLISGPCGAAVVVYESGLVEVYLMDRHPRPCWRTPTTSGSGDSAIPFPPRADLYERLDLMLEHPVCQATGDPTLLPPAPIVESDRIRPSMMLVQYWGGVSLLHLAWLDDLCRLVNDGDNVEEPLGHSALSSTVCVPLVNTKVQGTLATSGLHVQGVCTCVSFAGSYVGLVVAGTDVGPHPSQWQVRATDLVSFLSSLARDDDALRSGASPVTPGKSPSRSTMDAAAAGASGSDSQPLDVHALANLAGQTPPLDLRLSSRDPIMMLDAVTRAQGSLTQLVVDVDRLREAVIDGMEQVDQRLQHQVETMVDLDHLVTVLDQHATRLRHRVSHATSRHASIVTRLDRCQRLIAARRQRLTPAECAWHNELQVRERSLVSLESKTHQLTDLLDRDTSDGLGSTATDVNTLAQLPAVLDRLTSVQSDVDTCMKRLQALQLQSDSL